MPFFQTSRPFGSRQRMPPLPPFPGSNPPDCPSCRIHTTWLNTAPASHAPRFWRGNAWAVEVPGLPAVPGGSTRHPERAITGLLNRWSFADRQRILSAHLARNFSHLQLWTADALHGTHGATPQSLTDYAVMAAHAKAMGFYIDHMLLSKVTDPANATWDAHARHVTAIRDALVAGGAIDANDAVDVGWELDLWNRPGDPLQSIIDGVTELFAPIGCRVYVHFSATKCSWQAAGTSEEDWWRLQAGKPHPVTGIKWQADPKASIPLMQARFNALMRLFGRIGRFDCIPFELVAANQFEGDAWTEVMGAMYGYCLLCTTWADNQPVGPVMASGTGQGAWMPDGTLI